MKDYRLISWLAKLFDLCDVRVEYVRTKEHNDPFFSIPNIKNAKFLLPLQNGLKGYWRGLDIYPAMLPRLVIKKGLMAFGGTVAPVLTKNQLFLSCAGAGCPAQNLYNLLSMNRESIDRVKGFAARTGSAGAGFKLVFQFQDKEGEVVSYIKVGDPVYRAPFLLNEKKIFEYLNACSGGVQTPRVMGYKEHETFLALEISAVKKIRYFPRPSHENVAVVLSNLCKRTANVTKEVTNKRKERTRLIELYLDNEETRRFVINSLDYLSSRSFPRPLCHRDLAGWNLFFCENGKLGMLDWEFAKLNHLPFQDLYHYFLHTKIHNSRLSPVEAYRHVFEKDRRVREAIDVYGGGVGITDPELRKHLMVGYLWDWYSLERSRAEDEGMQGSEYVEILDWLAERHNYPQTHTDIHRLLSDRLGRIKRGQRFAIRKDGYQRTDIPYKICGLAKDTHRWTYITHRAK